MHPVVEGLLKKRFGESFPQFLSSSLNDLPPFGELSGLTQAACRLARAIERGETIGVYGDYDVDGTSACALLHHFFSLWNITPVIIQPHRVYEGYGLHKESIDRAQALGVDVLATVDCGITSFEAAKYAQQKEMDLIITDHHQGGDSLPPALAIVNPNQGGRPPHCPMRALSGVGVAFALAWEIKKQWEAQGGAPRPSLYPLLQFVALGSLCDLVPINPMNAKLIRHGLRQIPRSQYLGIRSMLSKDDQALERLPSERVSFSMGPLINSKGRLGHPEKALALLTEKDPQRAFETLNLLKECNKERKDLQAKIYQQACQQAEAQVQDGRAALVVFGPHWHEGVIGIVASKLVEEFEIPAVVLCRPSPSQGLLKGSARTAGALNLFEALKKLSDLFVKFGGHRGACGLGLKEENWPTFQKEFCRTLENIPRSQRVLIPSVDLSIGLEEVTPDLVKGLELLEPFGPANPRPTFKIQNLTIDSFRILRGGHVQWSFLPRAKKHAPPVRGISFFYDQKRKAIPPQELLSRQNEGQTPTVVGQLGLNHFRGNTFLQVLAREVQVH